MSQRLNYRSAYPDRLTPRYILDREARQRQRRFHEFLLMLGFICMAILMVMIALDLIRQWPWGT